MTSHPPEPPGYQQEAHSPAGYPPTPDYPPAPDRPDSPGHPPAPDHPDSPGYPPAPDYPQARGDRPVPGHPADDVQDGYAVPHEEHLHPGDLPASGPAEPRARPAPPEATAGPGPGGAAGAEPATGSERTRWAMLGYLTVPFFGFLVPLATYLRSLRGSPWARAHAAQAVNVWLTGILYDLSAAIIGAMLVLDSPRVALTVVLPLVAALWLTTLVFLMHAATAASRGEAYTFPRWLCAPMVR